MANFSRMPVPVFVAPHLNVSNSFLPTGWQCAITGHIIILEDACPYAFSFYENHQIKISDQVLLQVYLSNCVFASARKTNRDCILFSRLKCWECQQSSISCRCPTRSITLQCTSHTSASQIEWEQSPIIDYVPLKIHTSGTYWKWPLEDYQLRRPCWGTRSFNEQSFKKESFSVEVGCDNHSGYFSFKLGEFNWTLSHPWNLRYLKILGPFPPLP